MIGKHHKYSQFCNEPIENIENYELATSDTKHTWDLHHKLEIELNKTKQQLIDDGLYYGRPAKELIFLTRAEHVRLHRPQHKSHSFKHTDEAQRRIGEAASRRRGMKSSRIRKDVWKHRQTILTLHKSGWSSREIARHYNCSRTVILNIIAS